MTNKCLQKLALMLTCINLSQATIVSGTDTLQPENSTCKVYMWSASSSRAVSAGGFSSHSESTSMCIKVSEEEFVNLQATLSTKFNKDTSSLRYLFHAPRIIPEEEFPNFLAILSNKISKIDKYAMPFLCNEPRAGEKVAEIQFERIPKQNR